MIKKIWHDPVGSKIISAGAIAAIPWVANLLFHWWSWSALFGRLRSASRAAWAFVFASSSVPHWLIGLAVLIVVGIVTLIVVVSNMPAGLTTWPEFAKIESPAWLSYTSDVFHGLRWRWRYDDTGKPTTPICFCLKCDCQLVMHLIPDRFTGNDATAFHCVDCDRDVKEVDKPPAYIEEAVGVLIARNVRNEIWPTVGKNAPQSSAENPR